MRKSTLLRLIISLALILVLAACAAPVEEQEDCRSEGQVKIGQSIADTFDVEVDQIMDWYCAGNEFEDILLALQTSQGTEINPEDLLNARAGGSTWDEIWQEVGLVP